MCSLDITLSDYHLFQYCKTIEKICIFTVKNHLSSFFNQDRFIIENFMLPERYEKIVESDGSSIID